MRPKTIGIGFLLLIILSTSVWYFLKHSSNSKPLVSNFADCAALGYPIMESYPARCMTPDGRQFTQELAVNQEMIKITSVEAGDTISSPFLITGQARGTWYFEASFPITLENNAGEVLGTAIAQAQTDWMTENFVPFTANLTFNQGTSTQGILVFKKDNPSGLPEHEAELRLPVVLK